MTDVDPLESKQISSVCIFCGSSPGASPGWAEAARELGLLLAAEGIRLVYGGGGKGLMGACARGAIDGGGAVLGFLPKFLVGVELTVPGIELVLVDTMHDRKTRMFEESDGFIVLPGGIGTLEEAIELLSWRRMKLHDKPIVFYNSDGFWNDLFSLFVTFENQHFAPSTFSNSWRSAGAVAALLPTLRAMAVD